MSDKEIKVDILPCEGAVGDLHYVVVDGKRIGYSFYSLGEWIVRTFVSDLKSKELLAIAEALTKKTMG